MNILTHQEKQSHLKFILAQLQLAGARQSDADFLKHGNKGLLLAEQYAKTLLHTAEWEAIDIMEMDNSLGLNNLS